MNRALLAIVILFSTVSSAQADPPVACRRCTLAYAPVWPSPYPIYRNWGAVDYATRSQACENAPPRWPGVPPDRPAYGGIGGMCAASASCVGTRTGDSCSSVADPDQYTDTSVPPDGDPDDGPGGWVKITHCGGYYGCG